MHGVIRFFIVEVSVNSVAYSPLLYNSMIPMIGLINSQKNLLLCSFSYKRRKTKTKHCVDKTINIHVFQWMENIDIEITTQN